MPKKEDNQQGYSMYIKYKNTCKSIVTMSMGSILEEEVGYTIVNINYDFSSGLIDKSGCYLYKYLNDQVTRISDLDLAKKRKIHSFNVQCEEWILSGFESAAWGGVESRHYDYDEQDQKNITGQLSYITAIPSGTVYWKASNEVLSYEWTHEKFLQLCTDAKNTQMYKMQQYHLRKQDVLNATTIAEVDLIVLY